MLRSDLREVAKLIPAGSKVMDIGCGEGELLRILEEKRHVDGHGLEVDRDKASAALKQGLAVIYGDADSELEHYPSDAFDVVVLGQTLQAMKHPKKVLDESLRIGKKVIVVIPNFGQMKNRFFLLTKGRMPVTKTLSYAWYDTPNIHFCTIKDMIQLAEELGCDIEKRFVLDGKGNIMSFRKYGHFSANLWGHFGLFVLKRDE